MSTLLTLNSSLQTEFVLQDRDVEASDVSISHGCLDTAFLLIVISTLLTIVGEHILADNIEPRRVHLDCWVLGDDGALAFRASNLELYVGY